MNRLRYSAFIILTILFSPFTLLSENTIQYSFKEMKQDIKFASIAFWINADNYIEHTQPYHKKVIFIKDDVVIKEL